MPEPEKLSPAAVGVSAGLTVLALLFYALQIAALSDLAGSDAAGNGYAQGYAAIAIVIVWLLLAVLMITASVKGAVPPPAVAAAAILLPVSGFVAFQVLELLSNPYEPPHLWPIIIPALVPPLVMLFCFWALLPAMHARMPAPLAAGAIWGTVFILCCAIVPFNQSRHAAIETIAAAQEKYDAGLARLPPDAPLWDWVPFFETRNASRLDDILTHIRTIDRRQIDAELMLDRGDFPLSFIGRLDLAPTPTLCDKARALLRKRLAPLVLKPGETKPYRTIALQVSEAADAIEWLVGYDCSCDAESLAWENMTKAYEGGGWDVHRLAEARDPKQLGRVVRNYPERFSMLTPKAPLKAWLSFADKPEYHDQALAGARQLDHRTADAVEMLHDKNAIAAPWQVLKYLPALDLETNDALCGAALFQVQGDLAKVLRPKADDPRSYDEFLSRLGAYEPLTALAWLAGNGCDAERELSEAEAVIKTYQPSPSAGLMRAKLERLHRKK